MNKVKVYRASGNPVDYNHIEAFTNEHRAIYDKVIAKFQLKPTDTLSPELSQRLNKLFDRINKSLLKKYPLEAEWDEIKDSEKWLEAIQQYGNIMISKNQENGNLVYVIFDVEV